jgi:thiamine transport system ATP-binding protein
MAVNSEGVGQRGLHLSEIVHAFGSTLAVAGVTFDVAPEETVAILGPSGCGKSTLLAVIAGLLEPLSGELAWEGHSLLGVPPHRRGFGLMFQELALFPHLDVFRNVAYGLRARTETASNEAAIRARVAELLEWVGLTGYAGRPVQSLSGGEQQRVALARSLAPRPRLLMLDEPLGALDRILRERLLTELSDLLQRLRQTALYVTHDQEEAFALADRIVVMQAGRVAQIGTPSDIYRNPASVFVAQFLGMTNILDSDGSLAGVPAPPQVQAILPTAGQGRLLIRPDAARLSGSGEFRLTGRLEDVAFHGPTSRVRMAVGNWRLTFDLASEAPLPPIGHEISLSLDPERAVQSLP